MLRKAESVCSYCINVLPLAVWREPPTQHTMKMCRSHLELIDVMRRGEINQCTSTSRMFALALIGGFFSGGGLLHIYASNQRTNQLTNRPTNQLTN
jgi:hypothetical protein